MTTFLIATRNAHKVREIRQILCGDCRFLTLNDFLGAPAVVEDADTFEGNAKKKSVSLARWLASNPAILSTATDFLVLADDSGLEVDVLNGAPGVCSARFAALDSGKDGKDGNSSDADNNAKLLRLLRDVPAEKRTARFRCVIAVTAIDGNGVASEVKPVLTVDGTCEGRIASLPNGLRGFGYDPLFIPVGHTQSFAELGEEIKNKLSHRARALEKLKTSLKI